MPEPAAGPVTGPITGPVPVAAGATRSGGRAGRNLPAAIAVGVAMGAVVIGSLFTRRWLFVGVALAGTAVGLAELLQALRTKGLRVPVVPVAAGAVAMPVLAYRGGSDALVLALIATVAAAAAWRVSGGPAGYLADVAAAGFAAVYVPFLAGFAVLLTAPADGARRAVTFLVTAVCSDIGGYAAGVLFGRHLMAPRVSPKKTWEGLAGSVLACAVAGGILLPVWFDRPVWQGVLFGLAIVVTASVGDLGESALKRDIGIKDMGHVLPGHGGLMDRLDSLLPAAPVAWLLLTGFAPPH